MASLIGWTALLLGAIVIVTLALQEPRMAGPLAAAFIARAGVALLHVYVVSLTGGKGDAANFMKAAYAWSQDGLIPALHHFRTGAYVYAWLLSVLFASTAQSELLALSVNVLFGTLVTWSVWRLVLVVLGSPRAAAHAAWWVALFPSLVLFSAMTVREVAVIYPFTTGLRYLVLWWRDRRVGYFYLTVLAFAISALFHPGMIFAVVAIGALLSARWINALVKVRGAVWIRATVASTALFAVGIIAIGTRAGLEKFGNKLTAEAIFDQQQGAARSRAAYLQNSIPRSPVGAAVQIPTRTVYFFFTPFPWMVRTLGDAVACVDASVYLIAFLVLFRDRRTIWADQGCRALLVVLFFCIVPFAISTSNYGTAFRHRAKFAPLIFVLYATARERRAGSESLEMLHLASPDPA